MLSLRSQWPALLAGVVAAWVFVLACDLAALHLEAMLDQRARAETVTVRFTTPSRYAVTGGCDGGGRALDDPYLAILRGLWQTGDTLTIDSHASTDTGVLDSFRFQRIPQLLRVWVRTQDWGGNVSCLSNPYTLWQTGDVPAAVPAIGTGPPRRDLFDIAGRRIQTPARPGIYFERSPRTGVRRIVVLR